MESTLQQADYRFHIVQVLLEMGGKGRRIEVLRELEKKLEPRLSAVDYLPVKDGRQARWENLVSWEVHKMKDEGILKPTSWEYGQWEFTESYLGLD